MVGADEPGTLVQELAETLDSALQLLAGLDKPVVAGVRGAVAGAGLAVMLSCDLVVAGDATRFVAAYSAVGLTPDCGLSWLLPRAVGQQRALDLLLTNRVLPAAEAHSWGLVTELVPDDEVIGRAVALATRLADGPAWALGQTRRLSRGAWQSNRAEVGAEEAVTIGKAVGTEDAARLLAAFTSR
jgi:2-(1,2-epoxy-1,2-dihydrophenyl)acetyl-CoA isomerase